MVVPGLSQATSSKGAIATGSVFPATPVDQHPVDREPAQAALPAARRRAPTCRAWPGLEQGRAGRVRRALPRARPDGGAAAGLRGGHPGPLPADRLRLPLGRAPPSRWSRPTSCWRSATTGGRVARLGAASRRGRDATRCSPSPPRPCGRSTRRRARGTRRCSTARRPGRGRAGRRRAPPTDDAGRATFGGRADARLGARHRAAAARARAAPAARRRGAVELPAQLTVSSLVTLAARPARAGPRGSAARCRASPAPLARRGTAFHRWLETRWGQQRLLDDFELPGAADEQPRPTPSWPSCRSGSSGASGPTARPSTWRCRSRP